MTEVKSTDGENPADKIITPEVSVIWDNKLLLTGLSQGFSTSLLTFWAA